MAQQNRTGGPQSGRKFTAKESRPESEDLSDDFAAIPPERMADVVALAWRLYEGADDSAQAKAAALATAHELGIPREHLVEAAAQLEVREVAARKRRRTATLRTGLGLSLAAFLMACWWVSRLLNHPLPQYVGPLLPYKNPLVFDFDHSPETTWSLARNIETRASLSFPLEAPGATGAARRRHCAALHVDSFVSAREGPSSGDFWASLFTIDGARDFSHYRRVTFRARAEGLSGARLCFYATPLEDFTSQPVLLSRQWRTYTLSLDGLDRNIKSGWGGTWSFVDSGTHPQNVIFWQLQVGKYTNEVTQKGNLWVDYVKFQ